MASLPFDLAAPDQRTFVRACSIWRAMAAVGDVPTLLIIGSALLGGRRFDDFRRLTHLQQTTLSSRLKALVAAGLMRRLPIDAGAKRHEYRLTRTGVDLQQVALMLLSWERRWDTGSAALSTIRLTHHDCGQDTVATAGCAACHAAVREADVDWVNGPGEGFILAHYPRRRRQSPSVRAQQALTVFPDRINNVIGDRWSVLILRAIFAGNHRYDDINRDTRAATNILTERLNFLIDEEIIARGDAGDYRLTDRGRDTLPILALLMAWGDRWRASPEGPPVILRHRPCGHPLRLAITCTRCGAPMAAHNVGFRIEARGGGGARGV